MSELALALVWCFHLLQYVLGRGNRHMRGFCFVTLLWTDLPARQPNQHFTDRWDPLHLLSSTQTDLLQTIAHQVSAIASKAWSDSHSNSAITSSILAMARKSLVITAACAVVLPWHSTSQMKTFLPTTLAPSHRRREADNAAAHNSTCLSWRITMPPTMKPYKSCLVGKYLCNHGYLTPSLPRHHLKMINKSVKFETLFVFFFAPSCEKDFHQNA